MVDQIYIPQNSEIAKGTPQDISLVLLRSLLKICKANQFHYVFIKCEKLLGINFWSKYMFSRIILLDDEEVILKVLIEKRLLQFKKYRSLMDS